MVPDEGAHKKLDRVSLILRVGVYAFLGYVSLNLLALLLSPFGPFVQAAMSTFGGAAIASAVVLRIWERGELADIGLAWNSSSRHNLALGAVAGLAAALLVTVAPVIVRAADFGPALTGFNAGSMLFVTILLLFGAVGEEMLFRGYAFQLLIGQMGTWATILPFAVLFAFPHLWNENQTTLGLINTFLWGVVLGYAFTLSGDLWLPIGLHTSWNIALALLGANLSGFTMGVTGIALNWRVPEVIGGGSYGPEGGLLTTLVLAPLVWFLRRARIVRQQSFLAGPTEAL